MCVCVCQITGLVFSCVETTQVMKNERERDQSTLPAVTRSISQGRSPEGGEVVLPQTSLGLPQSAGPQGMKERARFTAEVGTGILNTDH